MALKAAAEEASTADSPAAASRTRIAEAASIPVMAARADRRPCPMPCASRNRLDGPGMTMMAAETRANASSVCWVGMTWGSLHAIPDAVFRHLYHAVGDGAEQAKIHA